MKKLLLKGFVVAGFALLSVPTLAQTNKQDKKEDKEVQHIVITRTGDTEEKTVIEIKGDKITINGKDVKEMDDVTVNLHKLKDIKSLAFSTVRGNENWNFNHGDYNVSLLSEDSNRAMLGVITDYTSKGAEITSITKNSAAEKAGLKKGDVITKIGERKITEIDDISKAITAQKPGDKVAVTIIRDGKEQNITAELGKWKGVSMNSIKMPAIPSRPPNVQGAPGTGGTNFYYNTSRPKLGMSVQDTEDGKGVKVLEVDSDGNAAKSGIKKDDIITHIDGDEVNSTDAVRRMVSRSTQQYNYNFKVKRGTKVQDIEVKLPRKLKIADL